MKSVRRLTALGCLLFASLTSASDGEEIALDKLPRIVIDHVKVVFTDAELLHARKEVEDGKECYTVRIMHRGRTISLYASPDGRVLARKQEVFSLSDLPEYLMDCVLFLLLPGVIAGACARWLTQTTKGKTLSVLSEWFSAWLGAGIIIGIILSSLATVPRHKDVVIIGARCVVWGAISASVVEVLGLTVQSLRGSRVACRRWILGFCLVALVFISLSIPVENLRTERENQFFRALAMRSPS